MAKRKLTPDQIEQACALREDDGLTVKQIITQMKLDVAPGTLMWHMLSRGADPPNAQPQPDFYKLAGKVYLRNGREKRHFTEAEDIYITAQIKAGVSFSEIGRQLTPQRRHSSIRGRLLTLARYEERQYLAGRDVDDRRVARPARELSAVSVAA